MDWGESAPVAAEAGVSSPIDPVTRMLAKLASAAFFFMPYIRRRPLRPSPGGNFRCSGPAADLPQGQLDPLPHTPLQALQERLLLVMLGDGHRRPVNRVRLADGDGGQLGSPRSARHPT